MKTTGRGQSALLLLDVAALLDRLDIRYMVVGAIAAAFYGVIRASQDADVVVTLPMSDLKGLEGKMNASGFSTELRMGSSDDPIRAVLALTDRHENRVDLLYRIHGMDKGAFSRCVTVLFLGRRVNVVGAEDFIAMKIFAGSRKDLDDARGVLEVAESHLDFTLLKKLTRKYGQKEAATLERMRKAKTT